MSKTAYLIGGGGHGRVVLDAVLAGGTRVAGIVDPGLRAGDRVFGVEVVGGDDWLAQRPAGTTLLLNGLGANPRTSRRNQLFVQWQELGYEFGTVLHPSAVLGRDCELAPGAQVMAGAVLQSRARVGRNAVINTRAIVDHDSEIGAHAFVAPGAVLNGNVVVENGAFVGAAAVVLPGVRIGEGAIIGAGAVVLADVPAGCTVVGNPAVRIEAEK